MSDETHQDYTKYLAGLPLVEAMWWFIENIDEEHPARSACAFFLRERYRNEVQS
jgi:hypothetical protein